MAQLREPAQLRKPTQFKGLAQLRGQIVDPPKSSGLAAVLVLCLIIILALAETNALAGASLFLCPLVYLILPFAVARRGIYAVHFGIFLIFCYMASWFPNFAHSPFNQLTSLLLYGYTVMVIPALRQSVGWTRMGKFNGTIWLFILAASVLSSAALVAWVKLASPDLSHYSSLLPVNKSIGMLLVNGLLFCSLNAAEEEIIWRGVMMEALDSAFGPGVLSIIIQAASFAVAHYLYGFPNGVAGSLIVFASGIMLGVIRRKSRGIVACWLAHMATDFTVYCLLVFSLK